MAVFIRCQLFSFPFKTMLNHKENINNSFQRLNYEARVGREGLKGLVGFELDHSPTFIEGEANLDNFLVYIQRQNCVPNCE